jgi:hypothetical protein
MRFIFLVVNRAYKYKIYNKVMLTRLDFHNSHSASWKFITTNIHPTAYYKIHQLKRASAL